ncbi:MAG TPA: DNA replication/repair protein RecF [Candidatus Obscuribacter sp.]|nr:DNA replication/repair protein RecF [Candidatus Obscuribacter sp.]HMX45877.1 DNA replication/repair protein RecF [Candidatus Obscuribacter sp.]HNA73317.1 DNA replication/repair protein RecF [Candidatus Obscuribacter sp.]HNH74037.1 DNA replication/repair protein RecF [Candidatus Obscuribacter sp.]
MFVSRLTVKNFRNYQDASLSLHPVRNLLIGDNAQGKTNLLEAIELLCNIKSGRATSDRDLILAGAESTLIEITYVCQGIEETVSLILSLKPRLSRVLKVNGMKVSRSELGGLSRLTAVSFSTRDLALVRGGPKERRDWLDQVLVKLRPGFAEVVSQYEKIVQQRNKLLRLCFERGQAPDEEEIKVWDIQLARVGARLVKARAAVLEKLLPQAEANLTRVSGLKERLSAVYLFRVKQRDVEEDGEEDANLRLAELLAMKEEDLAKRIYLNLKDRRAEEVVRKQTLTGPHRDDIVFAINDFAAHAFASQGQQRSLVLALKLAELKLVEEALSEPPLLLLDDVLAELDLSRQGMLMELVKADMQTLITTTHLDGFRPDWLVGAQITSVEAGVLSSVGEIG